MIFILKITLTYNFCCDCSAENDLIFFLILYIEEVFLIIKGKLSISQLDLYDSALNLYLT